MFRIKSDHVFDGLEDADVKRHSCFRNLLLTRIHSAEDVDIFELFCQILETFFDGLANFAGSLECLHTRPFPQYTGAP